MTNPTNSARCAQDLDAQQDRFREAFNELAEAAVVTNRMMYLSATGSRWSVELVAFDGSVEQFLLGAA